MKKIVVLFVLLALSFGIFAQGKPEATGSSQASTSPQVVTITFWDENAGPNRTPYYEKLIADFEATHPTIKVNYVGLPWSDAKSKYDIAIQSKTTPDVGGLSESWLADFVIKGALIPIDEYFNVWDRKDDMIPGYIDSLRSAAPDKKLYALLNTANIPVYWYRPDVLAENGLEVPKSWDDIFTAIMKTTDVANNKYGFSIRGGSGGCSLLEQMMYAYSGVTEMFDANGNSTINTPKNIEFVERLASIYNKYTPESDITNGYKEMVAAFDTKVANMIVHNLGSYGEHMKTLGAGNFAALTNVESVIGNRVVVTNGSIVYGVFNTSKHPKEAFTFMSWLCERDHALFWNETVGQLPTVKSALDSDYVRNAQHMRSAAETTANPNVTIVSAPINIPGYADLLNNVCSRQWQEVLLGNRTAKSFLDNWAQSMTQLKKEYDAYLNKK